MPSVVLELKTVCSRDSTETLQDRKQSDFPTTPKDASQDSSAVKEDTSNDGVRAVPDGVRAVPDGVRAVPDGVRAVPDGGWGWVVVLCSFIIHCINVGILTSLGLFYADLQDKFNISLTAVSWIGSVYSGIGSVAGLGIPLIIQLIGCRLSGLIGVTLLCGGFFSSMFANNIYILYLTLGFLPGIGHGFQHIAALSTVSRYFHRKRPLAIGITVSGAAMGSVIIPPLVTFLLSTFSLWGTFWLIGAMLLNEYWCDLTFRPFKTEGNHNSGADGSRIKIKEYLNLLTTKKMALLLFSAVCQSLVYFIFPSTIPTISRRQIEGLSLQQAAFILSVSGIVSVFGRVMSGVVSTLVWKHVLRFYILSLWGCGISVAIVTVSSSYPLLLMAAALYGMFQGGMWALQPTVVHHLFEIRMFTHAYGMFLLASGVAATVGVPFGSFLADLSRDDMVLFYMTSTGFVLAGLVLLPLTCTGSLTENKLNVKS